MSNNTKHYIGRKFSLQAFKTTCEPSEPIPGWAIRCNGAPAYIDEWGHRMMDAVLPNKDGKMITGYACHEAWTVENKEYNEMSQKVYIGRIFSRQVYEQRMSEIYKRPYNNYPWTWPHDCDGKPVYYYTDDEQKRLYIEDDDNCHYGCDISWTKPEAFKARDCNNCTYCNLNEQDKPCTELIEGELCKYYETSK